MSDATLPTTPMTARDYRERKAKRARRAGVLKHIFLIITSLIMTYPLIWMLAASFKPDNQIFGSLSLWPTEFDWLNYWQGWNALSVDFGRFFSSAMCCPALLPPMPLPGSNLPARASGSP
jgi:multiple sugar transport system permease protein